jgi:hypothetical protein
MERKFGEILMENGVDEGDVFKALSEQFDMPLIDRKISQHSRSKNFLRFS